jgi:hypothetical protein
LVRTKRFTDWLAEHARARKRVARIESAFAEPYLRERPRDPEKARLLRERGTPEYLIGPDPNDLSEDEAMALAVEAQHETRRQLDAD